MPNRTLLLALLCLWPALVRADDARSGKAVFSQCSGCHGTKAGEQKVGPTLHGLFHKKALVNNRKPTPATVLGLINQGAKGMPGYEKTLTPKQKGDLVAYLKTL